MRIIDEIKECVAFLCTKETNGYVYRGTAFFLGIPSEVLPPGMGYIYLITAKHNIINASREGRDLYLRLNTKKGTADFLLIPQGEWTFADDDAVDIAVMQVNVPRDHYFYYELPRGDCVTDKLIKDYGIGIGDEIQVIGLFTSRFGMQKNIPILRSGIIAAMPDEPMQDQNTGLPYYAYLTESRSVGGLSGSPVFVYLDHGRDIKKITNSIKVLLLGVIRGHWKTDAPPNSMRFTSEELEEINMGIAEVTPIQEVLKILEYKELVVN